MMTVKLQKNNNNVVISLNWTCSMKLLSISTFQEIQGNTQGQSLYLEGRKISQAFIQTIFTAIQNTINLSTDQAQQLT